MNGSRCFAALAVLATILTAVPVTNANAGQVLDRIVEQKMVRFGFRTDAPPFSFMGGTGPRGFTTDLCGMMAGAIMATSDLEEITGTFTPVDTASRFNALTSGKIDVLCGATTATLKRRETISFTIPIFATGVAALVSDDAPELMHKVLIDGDPDPLADRPMRKALEGKRLGVRSATTAEAWLKSGPVAEIKGIQIIAYDDHAEGLAAVAEGGVDVYFADWAILAGTLAKAPESDRFMLSRDTFTYEPYALAIPRGDEDLRLALDRALSHIYRSGAIFKVYQRHFGEPGIRELLFYGSSALPEG